MSQSPTWSASNIEPRALASTSAEVAATPAGASVQRDRGYGRLSPLQTAAATAVIFTSLVVLAGMTGVFSLHGSDEPVSRGIGSTSALRSAGGPLPQPAGLALPEPLDMITEVDNPAPALRSSPNLAADTPKDIPADAAPTTTSNFPGNQGNGMAPRIVPVIPAPQMAAATPPATQRSVRRAAPHQDHQRRPQHGKTREQVIEELMQAKRDGSYRALQDNYR